MHKVLIALMLTVAIPSLAIAGGGNSKATGKIRFLNRTDGDAYVILDQTTPPSSLADFNRKGGKRIPAGGNVVFTGLKDGRHTYGVVYTEANVAPSSTTPDETGSVVTKSGEVKNVVLNPE
ncbi:hypothetical protein Pla22_22920 [Rubripirellula amarantea]|uniref:Uncharacterized protein n=1 Tax=Rubripirellula amarantea TaxID=2527999 RepID=A0A5C5WXP5_9BACT|nr:hypothetical protein [Rubripirellula amarantea]TWT54642.1 hypothetical protein Pla22_22920 [Rubripirellula amarantea]